MFLSSQHTASRSHHGSIDIYVSVLTIGYWTIYSPMTVVIPPELRILYCTTTSRPTIVSMDQPWINTHGPTKQESEAILRRQEGDSPCYIKMASYTLARNCFKRYYSSRAWFSSRSIGNITRNFETLGLQYNPEVKQEDIKTAYLKLVKRFHPDSVTDGRKQHREIY